jgi:hypothetical protein
MHDLVGGHSVCHGDFARLAEALTRTSHPHEVLPIRYVADRPDHSEEQPLLSENATAMREMIADMTIKPTGDIDREFVAMMVPHH